MKQLLKGLLLLLMLIGLGALSAGFAVWLMSYGRL